MRSRGLTVRGLSLVCGVSQSSLQRWFCGEQQLTMDKFALVLKALDLEMIIRPQDRGLPIINYINE